MVGIREFRRDDILLLLEKLARGMQRDNSLPLELIVVGGSALALLGLRKSTHDIDSLTFLPDEIQEIICDIGIQDDLGTDWLNDRARAFEPNDFESRDGVMVLLWPRCDFRNSEEVVDAFWENYPHSPPDPHLVAYVDTVVARLSTDGASLDDA